LLGTVWYSLRETLRSFFIPPGDLNWRHNVSGYPLLNPIAGFLFLLGLAWSIRGLYDVTRKIIKGTEVHLGMIYPYLLLMIFGMLLPVITTAEGIPHGLRSVGLIVPIFMLAGAAGAVLVHWVKRKITGYTRSIIYGAFAGVILFSGLYDATLYFVVSRNDSRAAYAYRSDLTVVSQYINEYAARDDGAPRPYLVLDPFSIQTVHFLTSVAAHDYLQEGEVHPDEQQHKWVYVKPETSHLTVLKPGEVIIFTQSTFPDADRFEALYGNTVEVILSRKNRFNQEIMRVYGTRDAQKTTEFDLDA